MSLSAYERERLENIARNQAVLVSLGLAEGGEAKLPSSSTSRQPAPKRRKMEPRIPSAPGRRSARLVDGAKAPDYYIADESASGKVTIGGKGAAMLDSSSQAMAEADKVEADPLFKFGLGGMPEGESELLPCEQDAFEALRDAKRAKASELQIEGYKVAQHRSLAEMVRRRPESTEELRACWGFGGSGVRVEKYGAMFLEALRPHVGALKVAHAAARVEYEAAATAAAAAAGDETSDSAQAAAAAQAEAQAQAQAVRDIRAAREADEEARGLEAPRLPEKAADLEPGAEVAAYEALLAATHVRADELGEPYVWNIAMVRSLCEMVRRCPTTQAELRLCWGFGGKGVRADRHGDFLLAALAPHLDALRRTHAPDAGLAQAIDALPGAAEEPEPEDDEDVPLSRRALPGKMGAGKARGARVKAAAEEEEPPASLAEVMVTTEDEPDARKGSVPPRRATKSKAAMSPAPETRQTRASASAKRMARVANRS